MLFARSGRCASIREEIASKIEWQLQPCATPQRPLCLSSLSVVAALPRASFAALSPARWPQRPPSQWVLTVRSLSTGKNACPDDPHEQHENHAHGEGVEHQGEHDSDTSLIGSVVWIQLVHFVLPTFDTEQWAEE
jgi:hypothetical protein